jgi:hypothetical protein
MSSQEQRQKQRQEERAKRQASALRANLKRRKAMVHASVDGVNDASSFENLGVLENRSQNPISLSSHRLNAL